VTSAFQGASGLSGSVDRVFLFIVALSVLVLAGLTAAMIGFVVRYARERRPVAEQIEGNPWLEAAWTVIPTVLFLAMFWYGWVVWKGERAGPADATTVRVSARQFAWSFAYPGGKVTPELVLPLGRAIRLDVVSTDVVHGFFVPAFRAKVDAVPGRTNSTWVTPTVAGDFDVECTVICGPSHSYMLSKVHVVAPEAWDSWAAGPETEPPGTVVAPLTDPVARGQRLARAKGCTGCHSVDGSALVGPTFRKLWGRHETLEGGRVVTVDEPYFVRSIREPKADVVKGFPPAMPEQAITDAEIADLVAWVKTLQ
jgi:cytochrome c oxidase subunit 2